MIITASVRASTHIPSIKTLHNNFHISMLTIKQTSKNINIIVIHHAMFITLNKSKIENHQPILDTYIPS